MKTKLLLTAVSTLILSACAGVQTSQGGGTAAAPASTMYCWKRSLSEAGGNLVCNWEATSRDACKSIGASTIGKASITTGPRDAGRCDNGEWLVAVTTK